MAESRHEAGFEHPWAVSHGGQKH